MPLRAGEIVHAVARILDGAPSFPDMNESYAVRAASAGCVALIAVAPFETLRPVMRLPGQSLSSLEVVLGAVFVAFACAAVGARTIPRVPAQDAVAWALLVCAFALAALTAPEFRFNAWHMTARMVAAGSVWALCVVAGTWRGTSRAVTVAIVASGVLAAALVVLDYSWPNPIAPLLALFRENVAVVGTQVRASGPFQYPTIASMYLEVAFACGLGLLVDARGASAVRTGVLVAGLLVIAQGVVLTFTRAGLITMGTSLVLVGAWQWRRYGWTRETRAIAAVACALVLLTGTSRSFESLRLRFTTESQESWYSARIDAPRALEFETAQLRTVEVRVTNRGRTLWDPTASDAVQLSYHWIAADSDRVVAWEGERSRFDRPIPRGASVTVAAPVRAPGQPGRYRLLWDLEQPKRLWFSTEPGAELTFTRASVVGPPRGALAGGRGPSRLPRAAVRPGRFELWTAALAMWAGHPVLGVGPDNYRLLYGRYAGLFEADPRVHSNNMYLEVLAGAGLLGAIALVWLLVRTGWHCVRASRASAVGCGIAAAGAAIVIHGLVDSFLAFTGTYILFAVVAGLAAGSETTPARHAHRV